MQSISVIRHFYRISKICQISVTCKITVFTVRGYLEALVCLHKTSVYYVYACLKETTES